MSDEERIALLRAYPASGIEIMAAARIEELVATNEELEAKLAKAVEALQAFKAFDEMPTRYKRPDVFEVSVRRKLLSTLAEIGGEKT